MPAKTDGQIRTLHDAPPESGTVTKVADGILWARLPLPFRLNHVNVWFLEEPDGWTAIDSGADTPETRAIWETLFKKPLSNRPLVRHIATHGHTDHIGLSGWLVERFDMPFVSTLIEWLAPQVRRTEASSPDYQRHAERYLRQLGCGEAVVEGFRDDRHWAGALLHPMPPGLLRIRDGETIGFGGRQWRVITAGGHASEHASFYCQAEKLLIAGDQVLPTISPMIGVWTSEPESNPLAEYLASLELFRTLPQDTIVLPSHGLPFTGLHARIDQLTQHHEQRLDFLHGLLTGKTSAFDLTAGLFPKAVGEGHARLALAEAVAHINHLVEAGRAVKVSDAKGVFRYGQAAARGKTRAGKKAG